MGEGKGANSARDDTPTKLQTGFQSLTKDVLRFWMLDIRREGRGETSSQEETQGAPDQRAGKLRLGPRRGEVVLHPGRVCSSNSWLPELLGQGKGQTAGPTEYVPLWSI